MIGVNPSKSCPVTADERRDLLAAALAAAGISNVEPVVVKGVLNYFAHRSACSIITSILHSHHFAQLAMGSFGCAGYIWAWAAEQQASRMYRGVRTWARDGADEKRLEAMNIIGQVAPDTLPPPDHTKLPCHHGQAVGDHLP